VPNHSLALTLSKEHAMNRNSPRSLCNLGSLACACLILLGCGGGDPSVEGMEEAQKAAVPVLSHGPN
jgi:hypothetical protein